MSLTWKKIVNYYDYIFDDLSDPRTKWLPFSGSPWAILLVLFLYLSFIYKWGPSWMKNREPYNLRNVMIAYNIIQIALNLFIFVDGIRLFRMAKYSIICQPVSYEDTPIERTIITRIWLYYMVKVLDLFDTTFFVLRKKYAQRSALHTYHHTSIVLLCYFGMKYYAGGHSVMIGLLNSLVHVFMFTYYLLTVLDSKKFSSVWWKKYLTQMQIVQFVLLNIHFTHIAFWSSCDYPKWLCLLNAFQNNLITYLFVKFYIRTYIRKEKKA